MRILFTLRLLAGVAGLGIASLVMAPDAWSQAPKERVRVPTTHANVHMGPSSGQQLLVMVPRGTVLTVLARKGEWLQVQLSPELRKTGIVVRWYKNETSGWMHDSTVVPADTKSP
jgi:uncharacterized protein YgiM (DUF1202 family)